MSLIRYCSRRNIELDPIIFSVDNWTHGGASEILIKNNINFYKVPRKFGRKRPYFANKLALVELLISIPFLVYFFLEVFNKKRPDGFFVEQKNGFFEFIFSVFAQKYRSKLIIYQHGYEMFNDFKVQSEIGLIKSAVFRYLVRGISWVFIFKCLERLRRVKYDLCLVYSSYAEGVARRQLECDNFSVCGSLSLQNLLGSERLERLERSGEGVLICSNGFLRYANSKLRLETLKKMSTCYFFFHKCTPVKIRLKPGEFVTQKEIDIYFQKDDIFVDNCVELSEQLKSFRYAIFANTSTVGLECAIIGNKVMTYDFTGASYGFFPEFYKKIGIQSSLNEGDTNCESKLRLFSNINVEKMEFYTGSLSNNGNMCIVSAIKSVMDYDYER